MTSLIVHREGKHHAHVKRFGALPGLVETLCGCGLRTEDGWHDMTLDSIEQALQVYGKWVCRRCRSTALRQMKR